MTIFTIFLVAAGVALGDPDGAAALEDEGAGRTTAGPVDVDAGAGAVARRIAHLRARDAWLGEDKSAHGAMSFAMTGALYASGRALGASRAASAAGAALATAAAGLLKEWSDRRRGTASVRDLVWDALGIGAALLLVENTR